MNEQQFQKALKQHNLSLDKGQLEQFETYYHLLIEWNEKVNLTAITDQEEVYVKHFYDSLTPSFYEDFSNIETLCDVGAGAGFPSIPLKICYPHLKVTIIDSLQKRIHFLETLINELNLTNVNLVHGRAEDIGQDRTYREKFDLVTARAVARMNVLAEYCLPLCREEGLFIALKGSAIDEELTDGKRAIGQLGGKLIRQENFTLPEDEGERSLIWVKKVRKTAKQFPRKAGTPQRRPL
ncbi:MAG TPA: 16S rRNA (guanine(527)-N(7))-methyltransferase RsmG [Pseudogracilibacillus sp.]|nr:16S rRNA (guanine(527)-N(7))-methyltransferase RsmG [Pseudogracilibacillus sp.]